MCEDDATHKFYSDVAEFISSKGGNAVVVGGVSVEGRPGKNNYRLVVEFLGRPPPNTEGKD